MKARDPVPYKRILVKLSGEALLGRHPFGIDAHIVLRIAQELKALLALGLQVAVVIGGGNIFRGIQLEAHGLDRSTSDYMGMLATLMNALALQNVLEQQGVFTRVQSALEINTVCEPFIQRKADAHLRKGRVVIFAAGTGNPYFTTDTAAVLRAKELHCDLLLKGTKVDGVYCSDPHQNLNAKRFANLSYKEVLERQLGVMDMTAIALARDQKMPIAVFSIMDPGRMLDVVHGQGDYTLIHPEEGA
jgi:uridylate kinase